MEEEFRRFRYLRSLVGAEVADAAVVGEEVTAAEQLCREVDVAVILEEAVVVKLNKSRKS